MRPFGSTVATSLPAERNSSTLDGTSTPPACPGRSNETCAKPPGFSRSPGLSACNSTWNAPVCASTAPDMPVTCAGKLRPGKAGTLSAAAMPGFTAAE